MCAVSDHTFNWGEKVYSILSVVFFLNCLKFAFILLFPLRYLFCLANAEGNSFLVSVCVRVVVLWSLHVYVSMDQTRGQMDATFFFPSAMQTYKKKAYIVLLNWYCCLLLNFSLKLRWRFPVSHFNFLFVFFIVKVKGQGAEKRWSTYFWGQWDRGTAGQGEFWDRQYRMCCPSTEPYLNPPPQNKNLLNPSLHSMPPDRSFPIKTKKC